MKNRIAAGLVFMVALALAGPPNATAATDSQAQTGRDAIKHLVIREAMNMAVPAALALAVAKVESDFNPRARSHKGARGVMQIMPLTASSEYGITAGLLWNARINIRLGLHFLRRLMDRYEGRVDLALSHYNGGSRVGRPPNARVIPATRKYVDKVQRYRRKYRRMLYGKESVFGHRVAGESRSRGGQKL